eukprot:TRINITY_DN26542_c0_g1_i1.p1 TRINITY_DN26542_c0_g1~~TRINITY_DN26542_c0_g1_i1.p1  ORF type:complete len:313 (+),score=43.36 TRINITY_DN26542_c0_g1_i1:43-939(+)
MADKAERISELHQPMVSEPTVEPVYPSAAPPQQQPPPVPEYPEKPRAQPQDIGPYNPAYNQTGYPPQQQGYPMAPVQGYPAYYPVEPSSQQQPAPYAYPPNTGYAQPGYAQPVYYAQPGYPQPGYPQQQPPGVAYGQPVPVAQPIYVAAPAAVNQNETNYAILIFIGGFICCPIWFGALSYFRSANPKARLFARLSLGMLACCTAIAVIYFIVGVSIAGKAISNASSNCDMQYSAKSCFGASSNCRLCVVGTSATCYSSSSRNTCYGSIYYGMSTYCSAYNQYTCPSGCKATSFGCTM